MKMRKANYSQISRVLDLPCVLASLLTEDYFCGKWVVWGEQTSGWAPSIEINKTSQELRMLSSVTINCQETKIVINPDQRMSAKHRDKQKSNRLLWRTDELFQYEITNLNNITMYDGDQPLEWVGPLCKTL